MLMRSKTWPVVILVCLVAVPGRCAAPVDDTVRDDWYFRESLSAIRDWEAILDRWEKATPESRRTPILPVPTDGTTIAWPDPAPTRLLPAGQRDHRVGVRIAAEAVEVRRDGVEGLPGRETVKPGSSVVGYKHPGGGGKDQWYHQYERKFDRLTTFIPKPAPFALEIPGPLDFRRGGNVLSVQLRSASSKPLRVNLELVVHGVKDTIPCGRQVVELAPGAAQVARFPVTLNASGGSLLVLSADAGGASFWLPILAHVEDVGTVLAGVDKILADTPDLRAAAQLVDLRQRVERWPPAQHDVSWSALFEDASRLRDRLLLARIDFDALLFVKRKPYFSEQPFMDAHHLFNRPGGAIYRLSPVCPSGTVTPVVDGLGDGVYRDVCLRPDARAFLFAFGNGSDKWDGGQSYHIYEAGVDGGSPRRLTTGPKNDCEPFYLPDGTIGFTSDRSEHFVMCGGDRHAPNLYTMKPDGSDVRRLSYNTFNEFTPTVLDDGRILYSRWEYNERSVTSLHHLFTMHPDGTMVVPYYGNATYRPNVVMFGRPVPGSTKVMALFTAHHGQTHGTVGLIDIRQGVDGPAPLELLTPGVPLMGEHAEDSRGGWFSDPAPRSENTWLCSFTPTVVPWHEWSWGLYVADRHGNLALLQRDPRISCAEPVPMVPRRRPRELATTTSASQEPIRDEAAEATLVLGDVYRGLTGVPRGAVRSLRILEDLPRAGVTEGGVVITSGTEIYTIKRILGTVPVEADGSAHFVVPADRNVYFEALEADQREIQRMRSVVCLKPGETRSCIGCHEGAQTVAPSTLDRPVRSALRRPASRPVPPPWGTRTLSFLRDVQPMLNAKCVSCHTFDRAANKVILTDDLTDQFTVGYEELLPYLSVASAKRWDNPEDVQARPPYTYGSKISRLCTLLAAGHHGVTLTDDERLRLVNWVDANGVYYDRYESAYPDRHIFTGSTLKTMASVFERRCASCHGRGDTKFDSWALSLNRRELRQSRMLAAPLASAAGGWGRCDGTVFADANDPDYRALLAALGGLSKTLRQHPREDLISIAGTPAEGQPVEFPAPPPRRRVESEAAEAGWVYLSDLPWESAGAGWTRSGDGLPQRDLDVENQSLRLGARRFRKGVGTHAPSEIVYRLDGKYDRFRAEVGGAEAGGTVVFELHGNGRQLYRSGLMHGRKEVEVVDVSIAGVSRLRLVVSDGGDGIGSDMANWAGARLHQAGAVR